LLIVAAVCLWRAITHSLQPRMLLTGWWLAGMALAGLHAAHALTLQLPSEPARHDAVVTGRILDLPEHEPRRSRFLFRVDDDASDLRLRGHDLRLAWYEDDAARRSTLKPGQRWRFDVRLRAPRGLRNPGGADAEKFAMAQRIAAMGYVRSPETAQLLAPAHGIDAWRDGMSDRIATSVHRPSSRFIRALALGDVRGLDDADWTVLRANGLTHLIAISGFHVGLVAGFFALLVRAGWWLWPMLARRVPAPIAAAAGSVVGAGLYTAVAGFALPTVRTALMIAIVAGLRGLRRRLSAAQCLALAAFAMLLVDPLSALSAGFWLSFAGVAWLLWCLPDSGGNAVRDFLSAQGVASLGLLPVAAILFGQASLAGPLANLVAVPWWSLAVVPLALVGLGLESLHVGAGEWAWGLAAWCFDVSWPLFEWRDERPVVVVAAGAALVRAAARAERCVLAAVAPRHAGKGARRIALAAAVVARPSHPDPGRGRVDGHRRGAGTVGARAHRASRAAGRHGPGRAGRLRCGRARRHSRGGRTGRPAP